jgi:hypothetical protein
MAHFPPLVDEAPPCPRCGGRKLLVTVYMTAAYEQEVRIRDDGAVEAEGPDHRVYEEFQDASCMCRACGHCWED